MAGIKRESTDTTKRGTGGGELKFLSNEEVYSFYNGDKVATLAQELFKIATEAGRDSDRLTAIKEIFDRVLGKAKQTNINMNVPVDTDMSDEELLKLLSQDNVVKNLLRTRKTGVDKAPTEDK